MNDHRLPEFLPTFDHPQLARAVEALSAEAVDGLPFGVIHLDREGRVRYFSQAEGRLSGHGERPVVGRDFFREVAPCMDTPQFRGRIERALAAGVLDVEFGYTGDFDDVEKDLQVRVQSAADGGMWIFIQRV